MDSHPYQLPKCKLIKKCRKEGKRDGVARDVRDNLKYKISDDISIFCEGQFESLFSEVTSGHRNTIVGETYRVPSSDETLSIGYTKLIPRSMGVCAPIDNCLFFSLKKNCRTHFEHVNIFS